MESGSEDSQEGRSSKKVKNALELQRIQIEKLMKNPEREILIVENTKEKLPRAFNPHEFVRNVMGASAGAGSGEFDIYRGCRRRELIRQEYLQIHSDKEKVKTEFEKKRLANIAEAEKKTAKKRAKRLKQKEKAKMKKVGKPDDKNENSNSQSQTQSDADAENEEIEIDLNEKLEEEKAKEAEAEAKAKEAEIKEAGAKEAGAKEAEEAKAKEAETKEEEEAKETETKALPEEKVDNPTKLSQDSKNN